MRPLALGVAAVVLAGCGTATIDSAKLQSTLRSVIRKNAGVEVQSVRCPSGIKQQQGLTFYCEATIPGGQSLRFRVAQRDSAGHVHAAPLELIATSVTHTIEQRLAARRIHAAATCPPHMPVALASSSLCTVRTADGTTGHVKVSIDNLDGAYSLHLAP